MKRSAMLLVVVLAGTFVGLFPAPPVETPPSVTPTTTIDADDDVARSVAYCPWARSDALIDSVFALATVGGADAEISVLQAGTVAGQVTRAVPAFGGAPMSSVLNFGVEGAVIEFTAGPAAAASAAQAVGTVTVSECRTSVGKQTVVGGGSTQPGDLLELRLFNPFPQDAKISVRVTSENGSEPEASLESVSVPARSTRTFDLSRLFPARTSIAVTVTDPDGFVVAGLNQQLEGADRASWTAVTPRARWFVPFVATPSIGATRLVVVNDGIEPTTFDVSAYTADGLDPAVVDGVLEPRSVTVVVLPDDLAESGVEIAADDPISVFVVGQTETIRAATPGQGEAAPTWLLPGAGSLGTAVVAILNPTAEPVTVTVFAGDRQSKVGVEPGSVEWVVVAAGSSVSGVRLVATGDVAAAWFVEAGGAAAFAPGVPVR